ncbi:hypothetical protein CDV36_015331 [Fusarium kuroshium]|uniref:Uncharacterized protein n=2 Tax=Fusarium solani species complex TaxID=232080 RepID=A0A3M2RAS3_9HYPO|nr:hypothetical protein CDV36_015331 [Fusarium kuroshium]RSL53055.1 hypothetical protein CEP51_014954 [Fusarium floridanum]
MGVPRDIRYFYHLPYGPGSNGICPRALSQSESVLTTAIGLSATMPTGCYQPIWFHLHSRTGGQEITCMDRYGETNLFSTDPINAPAHYIPLRSDIHKIFDERHFCLVPKEPRSKKFADQGERVVVLGQSEAESTSREGDKCGTGERENDNIPPNTASQTGPCLVAHVFNSTPSGQLPRQWHNRRVHTLPSTVSVECLFVRLA